MSYGKDLPGLNETHPEGFRCAPDEPADGPDDDGLEMATCDGCGHRKPCHVYRMGGSDDTAAPISGAICPDCSGSAKPETVYRFYDLTKSRTHWQAALWWDPAQGTWLTHRCEKMTGRHASYTVGRPVPTDEAAKLLAAWRRLVEQRPQGCEVLEVAKPTQSSDGK